MSDELQENRLLDHNYDGIQEYDNPLPRWWVWLFWVSIVFAPLYYLYYHFGPGNLVVDAYNKDMTAFYERQAEAILAMGEIDESMIHKTMSNQAQMAGAQQTFQAKCSQCHGMNGEGGIGPNLTDDYWLHGNDLMSIYKTINNGVPTKGMVAWGKQLGTGGVITLSAYVGTLRGSEPPGPKAPQGDLLPYEYVPPVEDPPADDEPEAEPAEEPEEA